MKKNTYISLAVFILVLAGHFTYYFLSKTWFSPWAVVGNQNSLVLNSYFEQKDYFLGISYALALAFLAFSFLNFWEKRKGGAGVIGGLSLATILYAFGCFLVGCCGSPMLAVYLGLFGPSLGAKFLGLTKPIVAGLTLISVIIGYYLMQRKQTCTSCEGDSCKKY